MHIHVWEHVCCKCPVHVCMCLYVCVHVSCAGVCVHDVGLHAGMCVHCVLMCMLICVHACVYACVLLLRTWLRHVLCMCVLHTMLYVHKCVCVYVSVCMCVGMTASTYACAYLCPCMWACVCWIHICMRFMRNPYDASVYVYISVCMPPCMHAWMPNVCTHACMHVPLNTP